MAAAPPAWGVQYTLCLPSEGAARAAASELAGMGHRLTAVRIHDHFRFVPSSFWYGRPPTDAELEGWWQVFSLAVHSGCVRTALEPFLRGERIRMARIARSHGGFQQGYSEGHTVTLEKVFTRNGLVHDQAGAEVTLPDPLPTDPVLPPAAPPWTRAEIGEPEAVVTAVVAAAERMYGGTEDVPAAVEWLLEEDSAFGEPYETTGEFLSDLADSVAHQGTCTDDTAAAIPFMAELICDEGIPTGTRVILLGELLSLAVASPSSAVHLADRIAALGGEWAEPSANGLTRRAIARELPRLLSRWDEESDAARFVLAALTAACGSGTAQSRPELNTLPAPTATGRADAIALVRALLNEAPTKTALNRLSSSHPGITEHLDSPHMSARDLARAVLPDLVMRDIGPAITPGGSDHAGLARPGAAPRGVAVGRFPT